MARILPFLFLSLLIMAAVVVVAASEPGKNKSAWSTGKDEAELLAEINSLEEENTAGGDEFAGGFSTLDSMLQWAIGHSDPEELKEKAEDVRKLSPDELLKRQAEIKELMERLKMPSDAELMKIAIADLNNATLLVVDRLRALNELLDLVEPIDNANDLDKLGGLIAVIQELDSKEAEIRTIAAWILGKASQNNALVQNQILGYEALKPLMKMVLSGSPEEAVKALYAVSALTRNNDNAQELFYLENGSTMLQYLLTTTSIDARLQKKAALLVADLADFEQANIGNSKLPFLSDPDFLKSVVKLTSRSNLDLQEKALLAIRSLLQLPSTNAKHFKDFCGLDNVLDKMRVQLEELTSHDEQRDYAEELEILRREVQVIFHQRLEQVMQTST